MTQQFLVVGAEGLAALGICELLFLSLPISRSSAKRERATFSLALAPRTVGVLP